MKVRIFLDSTGEDHPFSAAVKNWFPKSGSATGLYFGALLINLDRSSGRYYLEIDETVEEVPAQVAEIITTVELRAYLASANGMELGRRRRRARKGRPATDVLEALLDQIPLDNEMVKTVLTIKGRDFARVWKYYEDFRAGRVGKPYQLWGQAR